MKNPLYINPQSGNVSEQLRAIINVLNILTNEMYNGRVKQVQSDTTKNSDDIENGLLQIQADMVEMVIDEYNSILGEQYMGNILKNLINKQFYADRETAINKVDTCYAMNKITSDQYAELMELIEANYPIEIL